MFSLVRAKEKRRGRRNGWSTVDVAGSLRILSGYDDRRDRVTPRGLLTDSLTLEPFARSRRLSRGIWSRASFPRRRRPALLWRRSPGSPGARDGTDGTTGALGMRPVLAPDDHEAPVPSTPALLPPDGWKRRRRRRRIRGGVRGADVLPADTPAKAPQ